MLRKIKNAFYYDAFSLKLITIVADHVQKEKKMFYTLKKSDKICIPEKKIPNQILIRYF